MERQACVCVSRDRETLRESFATQRGRRSPRDCGFSLFFLFSFCLFSFSFLFFFSRFLVLSRDLKVGIENENKQRRDDDGDGDDDEKINTQKNEVPR